MQVFIKVHLVHRDTPLWINVFYIKSIRKALATPRFCVLVVGGFSEELIVEETDHEVLDLISGVGDTEGKRITLE